MAKNLDDIFNLLESINKNLGGISSGISATSSNDNLGEKYTQKTSALGKIGNWGLQLFLNKLESAFDYWKKFEKESFDVGRSIGLNSEALRHFDNVHRQSIQDLSHKYGLLGKDLIAIQDAYSKTTGKARLLTAEQLDFSAAIHRMVGPEVAMSMADNMDKLGGSIDTANARLGKMWNTATKWGLNAQESAKVIAKNVGLASSYHFKGGTEELSKMVLKSQSLRMNFEAIAKTSEKFTSIESAISTAANIQMLGGSFAQAFGNPLEVMYEATSDQAAYMERIFSTLEGKGTYNAKTGEVEFSPVIRQFMRAYAQELGMSVEELIKGASSKIQHAEIEKRVEGKGLSIDQLTWLKNQATFSTEKGDWVIANLNQEGEKIGEKTLSEVTAKDITQLRKNIIGEEQSFKDIRDIRRYVQDLAEGSTPFVDKWNGVIEGFGAKISNWLDGGEYLSKGLHGLASWGPYAALAGIVGGSIWGGVKHWSSNKMIGSGSGGNGGATPSTSKPSSSGGARGGHNSKGRLGRKAMRFGAKVGGLTGAKIMRGVVKGGPLGLIGFGTDLANDYMAERGVIEKGGTANKLLDIGASTANWAATGALVGSIFPVIGTAVGTGVGALGGAIKGIWTNYLSGDNEDDVSTLNESADNVNIADTQLQKELTLATIDIQNNVQSMKVQLGSLSNGLIASSLNKAPQPIKDNVIAQIGNNEQLIANAAQSTIGIYETVSSIRAQLGEQNTLIASQPIVGQREYISRVGYDGGLRGSSAISETINLNINGTLRLSGDKNSADIDIRKLMEQPDFKRQIVDIVHEGMNNRANNGRGQLMDSPYSIRGGAASKNNLYMT